MDYPPKLRDSGHRAAKNRKLTNTYDKHRITTNTSDNLKPHKPNGKLVKTYATTPS